MRSTVSTRLMLRSNEATRPTPVLEWPSDQLAH
jgi:hypothetical protein